MAISATSTGIDVDSIVNGLMSIERQPLKRLDTKETSYQAKITAFGLIKSKLDSFLSASQKLGSLSFNTLDGFKAASSDTSLFTATASSEAVAGTYALEISALAQSQKLVATGQTSKTAAISDGTATTVSFDLGTISGGTFDSLTGKYTGAGFATNGSGITSITIDGTNNTLEGIRDAINAANMPVTATIVNDGSGTPYRLALSSDSTGVSNSIKITTSGGDGTIDTLLAHDPAALPAAQHLSQTAAAQNANFKVNGIAITKTSNSVTDAIQGVTLTLGKVTTTPATLTVERDTAAVTDAVNNLAKSYNELYSAMRNSAAYKSKSALEGDSTLRSLQTQMRSIASSAASGGTMTNLHEIGVSFKVDGTMQVDSAKLDSAMAANFSDVTNLLKGSTGFATKYEAWASQELSISGSIASRTDGLNKNVKDIGTQREIMESRMSRLEKQYRTQYSSLNVTLSRMGATSEYLSRQLK
ncbi:MAG: flagellar filament capping protein FliD [Sulfuricellaceae bacterium]|nr:flagellar filament capping protein FliD [Sulfuricellaceae bacterium]